MRTLCHLLLATAPAAALVAPSVALADSDATLTIDNRFDGEAEVFVDGKLEGIARGDAATCFDVRPGLREVVVSRPGTHFVLATARVAFAPHATTALPVVAPTGSVRVDNDGEVALKLELGPTTVWLQPGTAAVLPVKTGNVELQASIHDPRGDWMAIERGLWVEPGQLATTTLKPDPAVIVVTNRDLVPVRAVLDGVESDWIQPGDTDRLWVRPGATRVVLEDRVGRVLSTTNLLVGRGDEAKVVLGAPTVVVHGDASIRPPS